MQYAQSAKMLADRHFPLTLAGLRPQEKSLEMAFVNRRLEVRFLSPAPDSCCANKGRHKCVGRLDTSCTSPLSFGQVGYVFDLFDPRLCFSFPRRGM